MFAKTVFVTGAAGFIGSNLVLRLLKQNEPVNIIGMDNMNDYYDVSLKEYRLQQIEELAKDKEKNKEAILATHKEYLNFYSQAFDGFVKAMSSENYPMCGMEQNTVDLLIAAMAYNLGKYDFASRFVSNLLVSRNVGSNIKNRAYDLKEKIIEKIKK